MARAQVHVTFYMKAMPDKKATREAGRPVFKDMEYVKIKYPGDNKRELHAPAHSPAYLADQGDVERGKARGERVSYAERYPEHYAIFLQNKSAEQVVGTPLSELPFLTEAQRQTLRAQNVMTAETLAALEGAGLKSLGMNARTLKEQASAYLKKAEGMADTSRLAAENAELSDRLQQMEAALAEMQQKRGRPRKDAEAA